MLPPMWTALACIAGLGALVNLIQVVVGRQLIRPSASKRSTPQLRRESAAAVPIWLGMVLLSLHIPAGLFLEALGMVGLRLARKRPIPR
jgi:hypothetical protein